MVNVIRSAKTILLCMLAFTTLVVAKDSPLKVSATVTEVSVGGSKFDRVCDKANAFECKWIYDRNDSHFVVKVRIQFINRGDSPLIVPEPAAFPGTKKFLYLEIPDTEREPSATGNEWFYSGRGQSKEDFVNALSARTPYKYFRVIEPGQTVETMDSIRTTSGFKIGTLPPRTKGGPDREIAIPEYPYFKITYSLSMEDTLPVAEARQRWRQIGELFTTSDGDFAFETGLIINKLAE